MKDSEKIELMPLSESDRGVAAYLMIYSVYGELSDLIPKIELGGMAIKNGIIIRKFYKAVSKGRISGLISLSDSRSAYMELDYAAVKKQFGAFKAKRVYAALDKAFSVGKIPDGMGYISYPICCSKDRLTVEKLFEYVLALKKYNCCCTCIPQGAADKRELLESLGFKPLEGCGGEDRLFMTLK